MGFSCGIVGLPNAGKSTIFNALTGANSPVAPYPFCTIDPKEGVVAVPDERLAALASLLKPPQVTPTTLTFVDIAGLVEGAHRGEGLGNRFLSHIREVDAVVHVVRGFGGTDVAAARPGGTPAGDLEVILAELMLADLETVARRRDKNERMAKVGDKEALRQLDYLHRLEASLGRAIPASRVPPRDGREEGILGELFLLSAKPALVVVNCGEEQLGKEEGLLAGLDPLCRDLGMERLALCGKLEAELVELPPADRAEFMADLGLERMGLERLVAAGYRRLDLVTFYTTVGPELRAWTVPRGTAAAAAAGRIHSDMEAGFIKAEVVPCDQFLAAGSESAVRKAGAMRAEGRDYPVADGDIVLFHFRS